MGQIDPPLPRAIGQLHLLRVAIPLQTLLDLPLPAALDGDQLVGCQLGRVKLVLLQEGFGDRLQNDRRLAGCRSGQLLQTLAPQIPLGVATPAQAGFNTAARVDVEHHGLRHILPTLLAQAGTDRVETLGTVEARPKIISKAAQCRSHRIIHLLPVGNPRCDRLPDAALKRGHEERIRLCRGDRITKTHLSAIGIDRRSPADRMGFIATERIRVGVNQTITGLEACTTLEVLNQTNRLSGYSRRHHMNGPKTIEEARNPGESEQAGRAGTSDFAHRAVPSRQQRSPEGRFRDPRRHAPCAPSASSRGAADQAVVKSRT